MNEANPIELLFDGMEKLGPGSNADTLKVLDMIPELPYQDIVDAGCGAGRQTLVLANKLKTSIHAVDSYEPFLNNLMQHAKKSGIEHLIQTHCIDMADIPKTFQGIDLLWSEGAAYNIGFFHALKAWHSAIKPNGIAVVSELSWLRESVPVEVRNFFKAGYPDMRSVDENRSVIEDAGYNILGTHILPKEAWVEDYYDILEPRAKKLLDHPDESVREFVTETMEEIRIFGCSEESYGYVFYVIKKA